MIGHPILEVLQLMQSDELPTQMNRVIKTPAAFLQLFGDVLARSIGDNVHIGGRLNVLDFGENVDETQKVKHLLEFLSSAPDIRRVATAVPHQVTVKIGQEIDEPLLQSFSLITSAFQVPNQGDGVIALLGPIRMPYARNVLLMDAFGEALSQKMLEYT